MATKRRARKSKSRMARGTCKRVKTPNGLRYLCKLRNGKVRFKRKNIFKKR